MASLVKPASEAILAGHCARNHNSICSYSIASSRRIACTHRTFVCSPYSCLIMPYLGLSTLSLARTLPCSRVGPQLTAPPSSSSRDGNADGLATRTPLASIPLALAKAATRTTSTAASPVPLQCAVGSAEETGHSAKLQTYPAGARTTTRSRSASLNLCTVDRHRTVWSIPAEIVARSPGRSTATVADRG